MDLTLVNEKSIGIRSADAHIYVARQFRAHLNEIMHRNDAGLVAGNGSRHVLGLVTKLHTAEIYLQSKKEMAVDETVQVPTTAAAGNVSETASLRNLHAVKLHGEGAVAIRSLYFILRRNKEDLWIMPKHPIVHVESDDRKIREGRRYLKGGGLFDVIRCAKEIIGVWSCTNLAKLTAKYLDKQDESVTKALVGGSLGTECPIYDEFLGIPASDFKTDRTLIITDLSVLNNPAFDDAVEWEPVPL